MIPYEQYSQEDAEYQKDYYEKKRDQYTWGLIVAEEKRWLIAILAALLARELDQSWIVIAIVAVVSFWLSTAKEKFDHSNANKKLEMWTERLERFESRPVSEKDAK